MKYIFSLIGIVLFNTSISQPKSVLTNPNKFVKGQREGLWSEFKPLDTIDFNGTYHLVRGYHLVIESVIAEGNYKKNEKQGFWKSFWILWEDDRIRKGGIKSIIEYRDNVPSGLVVEYYRSGNIKAIGQYELNAVDSSFTLQIPDWKDSNGGKMKDTVIHQKWEAKPKGNWKYFMDNGKAIHKKTNNGQHTKSI